MANQKVSDLTALGGTPANDDVLYIVDTSATASKKVTYANLMAGAGSSGGNIVSAGARMNIGTSNDAGSKGIMWGGTLGFCYYIWSSNAGDNPLTTGGDLGTPGSTQMTVDLDNITNGLFRVPIAGTAGLYVNQEFDGSAEVAGVVMRYFMYKCDSATVTALENGTGDTGSLTATLVASAKLTVPASSQNIKPMVVTSSNGVSLAAGDLVFGCTVYDGTVTTTQFFPTNIQMFTT
jgi:hypothetical protein|tara:strand:+ start:2374 stop:3078 length:705 start_codon:yes stop_codon:yes gene_type:complete